MTKTAWVFPGQGSQTVGMGADLKDLPAAKHKLNLAEQILGWSVIEIAQTDEARLSNTLYTQPCLYAIESIMADSLLARGEKPDLVAGHSLGEYVALYAAGVFDFETGLRLVKRRAELMHEAAGGKMVAMMKFDRQELEAAIDKNPDVTIANDNSAAQVVISGTPAAVDEIVATVKAKRAVTLKVSGAFHSKMMDSAAAEYGQQLESVNFSEAKIPVICNVEPSPTTDPELIQQRLVKQMTGSVRWRETMLQFPEIGISKVVEIGPGKVLTGLLKRTCREIETVNLDRIVEPVAQL